MTEDPNIKLEKSEVSGFIIERTAKRMKQYFQRMLKATDANITVDQWVILQELHAHDGLSQYEIGERTYKDAPTVTRIIDLMSDKNLIRREPDREDRRKFNILLTRKGRQTIEEVLPTVKRFRQAGWRDLSEDDLNDMMRILNKIFDNLEP